MSDRRAGMESMMLSLGIPSVGVDTERTGWRGHHVEFDEKLETISVAESQRALELSDVGLSTGCLASVDV